MSFLSQYTPSKEDFENAEWQNLIENIPDRTCVSYFEIFKERAVEAENKDNEVDYSVFVLLNCLTSLHLNPNNDSEPLGPLLVLNGNRTAIVDDFENSHLDIFTELIYETKDAEMCARLADVVWISRNDFTIAGIAVNSYLEASKSIDSINWTECTKRLERAFQIAVRYGKNGPYFSKVKKRIEALLRIQKLDDISWLPHRLMTFLLRYEVGNPNKYILLCTKLAEMAEKHRQWRNARDYWYLKSDWHRLDGQILEANDAYFRGSETYEHEAHDALQRADSKYMGACIFLEEGIQAFRKIGGDKARSKVEQLHKKLLEYQEKINEEMGEVEVKIDLTEYAHQAIDAVKGKTIHDAILTLAKITASPKVNSLNARIKHIMEVAQLQFFVPVRHHNDKGKITARRDGLIHNPEAESDKEKNKHIIQSEILRTASLEQGGIARGVIIPAVQQINLDHNPRISDFYSIVINNPFIPEGREKIYAKGLHAGLVGDYLVASNLLIPQIENSLRYILWQLGTITSKYDDEGIQEEYSLNWILDRPELKQLWGEDIIFDLKGLLVEKFGSNLRNLTAHGLIDHDNFYSMLFIYIWWLTLRLCCLPILAQIYPESPPPVNGHKNESDSEV